MNTKQILIHTVTLYDQKENNKKGYNPYALPQYFMAVDNVIEDLNKGKSLRMALVNSFCGKLLDLLLKSVGETRSSKEEQGFSIHEEDKKYKEAI